MVGEQTMAQDLLIGLASINTNADIEVKLERVIDEFS